ncbi:MAG TPA: cyclic nucleotide-binding domain-containing protein [Candidatus Ozemobacteraceae bacterium]
MLDTIELFNGLTRQELEQIASITVAVTYNRGEVIFQQGDFSRDFYIVKSGQIEVSVRDIFQEHKVVAVLKNGDFFGEMALFDKDSARSATTTSLQQTILLKIPGQDFERLLREKPSISFKLLGALSRRLKTANVSTAPISEKKREAKVITVASARNGYGKTTFATTLAHMLGSELPRKVLYLDLDVYFGDGTFVMGVFSPKSVLTFFEAIKTGISGWDVLVRHLVRHTDNLYSLPAPADFLEGEKVSAPDLVAALKVCRQYFDYLVIDTDSSVSDLLLNAIDLSDHLFFLVDTADALAIKNNARFLQGMGHLNINENRVNLLVTRTEESFDADKVKKLFKYRVLGGLPEFKKTAMEHGQTMYQRGPTSPYCNVVRLLVRTVLQETALQTQAQGGFIYRFLFAPDKGDRKNQLPALPEMPVSCDVLTNINEESCASLLKYARANITHGNLEKAQADVMRLVPLCPRSSAVYQILGEIFTLQKNISMAVDALKKAIELDPENHMALGYLAHILSDSEMRDKALTTVRSKISSNPDFPDLHNDCGKLLFQFHQYEEAIQQFRKALELNPQYAEARLYMAMCMGENNEIEAAIRELMNIKPKSVRVYYLLGIYFNSAGQFYESMQALSVVENLQSNYFDVAERLATLREYFDKLNSLLNMHQELLDAHPNYPDLHLKMGNLLMMVGRYKEAEQNFKEALKLNPGYTLARQKLEALANMPTYTSVLTTELEQQLSDTRQGSQQPFDVELRFEKLPGIEAGRKGRVEAFAVRLRNQRGGREITMPLSLENLADGKIVIHCTGLGRVMPDDLLVLQMVETKTNAVVASMPALVTANDLWAGRLVLDLTGDQARLWHYPGAGISDGLALPVRYFCVTVQSPALARGLRATPPVWRAELTNPNTNAKATGYPNPDQSELATFTLTSTDGKDVVRVSDRMHLRIFSASGREVVSMDFTVLQEDIDAFCKTIAVNNLPQIEELASEA